MSYLLSLFIFLPLLALALIFINKRSGEGCAGLTGLGLTLLAGYFYLIRPFNKVIVFHLGNNLVLDGFSHLILLAVNLVTLLVIVYAWGYMAKADNRDKFYQLLLAMLAGVNGVLLAGDFITLFIFLELAALAAYALVAFGRERRQLEAAFKYFILGEVASLFLLLAGGLILAATGTFNLAEISQLYPMTSPLIKSAIAILLLVGLGMKAALVPFHTWLPDAHTAAPSPVSAMLSGIVIKVLGIYVLVRLFYNVLGLSWQVASALTLLGGTSILVGSFLMVGQKDLKRLMAYSSVAQIGYILVGFGLATPLGIMGGIFHLVNHVFMKSLLFLDAGAVEKATGTRNLDELGGLSKELPVTTGTTLVGSLSISGIPPFNGFWSKLFIILACIQAGRLWLALIAIIGSILTLAAFAKVMQRAFWGKGIGSGIGSKIPASMIMATVILSLCCLGIGLAFPILLQLIINPAVVAVLSGLGYGRMILGGV